MDFKDLTAWMPRMTMIWPSSNKFKAKSTTVDDLSLDNKFQVYNYLYKLINMHLNSDSFYREDQPMLGQIFYQQEQPILRGSQSKSQFDWIDEYLFPDVLKESRSDPILDRVSSQIPTLPTVEDTDKKNKLPGNGEEKNATNKNRSIFHNVQKHLITFLKKISIRRIDLVNKPSGLRAYELWRIFKASKDYTKKGLYMIFGVAEEHNEQNLKRLALNCPELERVITKFSFESIEQAQAIIRERVFLQVSEMPKTIIRHQCKMAKFEEFYDYLQTFLEELSGPGLSIRMKKEQKLKVVEKLNQNLEDYRITPE